MEEIWKHCFDDYEVSNLGNVRRRTTNGLYKQLKCSIQNRGYKYFQINRGGKRTNHLIHHLVAQYFIGDRPDGLVIDHIDRDKLNNCFDNLRYVTQKFNSTNTDKYLTHIEEQDPKKRAVIRTREYTKNNREDILQKKKEHYQKNREKLLEYNRLKRLNSPIITQTCINCKCQYGVKQIDLKNRKTELCHKCVL